MSKLVSVPIREIDSNPFRLTTTYPYVERKLEALARSYADVGMWEGIIARNVGNRVQIAFGHHRVEAARRKKLAAVPVIVRDLTDQQMIQFMGRENLEDYNADFLCMLETWEAAARFRSAVPEQTSQHLDIARLLGWMRPSASRDSDKMNDTASACRAASALIQGGYLARNDLINMSVGSARPIVERAQSRMEQLEAIARRTGRPHAETEKAKRHIGRAAKTTAKEARDGTVANRDLRGRVDLNAYRHHKEAKKDSRTPLFAIFAKSLAEQIARWNNTDTVRDKIDEMVTALPSLTELEDLQAIDRVVLALEHAGKRNAESIRKLTAKPAAVIKLRAIQEGRLA